MADVERLALSCILRNQDVDLFIDAKITVDYFLDEEHRPVWEWMLKHWQDYGNVPGRDALEQRWPVWKMKPTPEEPQYYLDLLRDRHAHGLMVETLGDVAHYLNLGEVGKAQRALARANIDVNAVVSKSVDSNLHDPEEFRKLYEHYDDLASNPNDIIGLRTGFTTVDLATMGVQPSQLITLVGPPKAGKTTLWIAMAKVLSQQTDVLGLSFEMSRAEIAARYVGQLIGVNYRMLLKGRATAKAMRAMRAAMEEMESGEGLFKQLIISEDVSSTTTVSGVLSKLREHRPGVVMIDGVYMMDDEHGERKGTSQALTNITRGLKRICLTEQVPLIITTQALESKMRRGGRVEGTSIGYSSSFSQDSDVVIATERRESDAAINQTTIGIEHWIKVLYSRVGALAEAQIHFDHTQSKFDERMEDGNYDVESENPSEADLEPVVKGKGYQRDDLTGRRSRRGTTDAA